MIWTVIAALSVATLAMKASGPLVLGDRQPSERALRVISLVAPAVLTGLVLYESLGGRRDGVVVDGRLAGVAAAAVTIALRAPMAVVILAAAAATAAVRLLA